MFDIGFFELFLVAVVALLVLGPEKLPQALRKLGLYIGHIKQSVASVQQEVNEQLQLEEMRARLAEHERKVQEGLTQAEKELTRDVTSTDEPSSTAIATKETPSEPVK